MSFFEQHKNHLAGLLLVVVLFIGSIVLREERISAPLNRHHEWITAHALITMEIWHQNGGPSAYGFNPVYSYPGKGNQSTLMLGGMQDKEGNQYYVSYPPFAFIFGYYFTELIGGPSVFNMRVMCLFLHLICTLLIYFLVRSLSDDIKNDRFQLAAVTASFLYLFSTMNLWAHANLYFSDMLEQVFLLLGLLLIVRQLRNQYRNERAQLIYLGLVFFFATYTEWLGLFLALVAGLTLLVFGFLRKEKHLFRSFVVIGVSSALALGLTIAQYSSIDGFDRFKEVSLKKYEYRSGHTDQASGEGSMTVTDPNAYQRIEEFMWKGYKMAQNYVGLTAILLGILIFFRKLRARMKKVRWRLILLMLVILPVAMHYYLFFNFNAVHDFSTLKTGTVLILISVMFLLTIEEALQKYFRWIFGIGLLVLAGYKGYQSFEDYDELVPMAEVDYRKVASSEKIRQLSHPEIPVYINTTLSPVLVFYAKHNMTFVQDTSFLPILMTNLHEPQAQYYHHSGTQLEYMLDVVLNDKGQLVVLDKLVFYDEGSGNNVHHFQK